MLYLCHFLAASSLYDVGVRTSKSLELNLDAFVICHTVMITVTTNMNAIKKKPAPIFVPILDRCEAA